MLYVFLYCVRGLDSLDTKLGRLDLFITDGHHRDETDRSTSFNTRCPAYAYPVPTLYLHPTPWLTPMMRCNAWPTRCCQPDGWLTRRLPCTCRPGTYPVPTLELRKIRRRLPCTYRRPAYPAPTLELRKIPISPTLHLPYTCLPYTYPTPTLYLPYTYLPFTLPCTPPSAYPGAARATLG